MKSDVGRTVGMWCEKHKMGLGFKDCPLCEKQTTKDKYYAYKSPMRGYDEKVYFANMKEARKWVKNRPYYPTIVHHIYKMKEVV
jgi:hypothetical protein